MRTNLAGGILLGSYFLFTEPAELAVELAFAREHPRFLPSLAAVGCSLGLGVVCYMRLIEAKGSVFAVVVATGRKVLTVWLSFVVFAHPVHSRHFYAGVTLLGGVAVSTSYRPS